jgi:hypothetical protein
MPTITELAAGNENFIILSEIIVAVDINLGSGLVGFLDSPNFGLTIFAPADAAFLSLTRAATKTGSKTLRPALTGLT